MARFAAGVLVGATMMLVFGAAIGSHARDPETDVQDAATAAQVDPVQLQGALNSLKTAGLSQTDPYTYLRSTGELPDPGQKTLPPPVAASPTAPASGVSSRVTCIEGKESGGLNIPNARGSGAGGVLQYLPSTFAAHAAEMGHPEWSLWNPAQARAVAAHDLALGRRSQWTVTGC